MPKQKVERNERIWRDFEAGISRKEICQKYEMTMSALKSLIRRMRERKGLLTTSKPAIQQTSKLIEYRKATYYLAPEMIKGIKRLAVDRDMDISELVREILGKYLKGI